MGMCIYIHIRICIYIYRDEKYINGVNTGYIVSAITINAGNSDNNDNTYDNSKTNNNDNSNDDDKTYWCYTIME